jgi:hypothetical protein
VLHPIISVEVTLHVVCKMPSLLEIYFSTQQLRFVADYKEPCDATESWTQDKDLYLMVDILPPIIYLEEFDLLS